LSRELEVGERRSLASHYTLTIDRWTERFNTLDVFLCYYVQELNC